MYSENGTYYVPHPAAINYTADPSPELDRAWEELTWGRMPLRRSLEMFSSSGVRRAGVILVGE